jgi:3-hydroxymyristoyl/3-hydroxydecanoyl-(acyl carrier protein) dehydratase
MSVPASSCPRVPQARPFLLLDRVVGVEGRRGTFLKLVTAGDPCVGSDGVLPPVLLLEALAQGGGALLSAVNEAEPTPGYLAAVGEFRALEPVRVGHVVRVEVEVLRRLGGAVLFHGRALVGDRLCAEGRFSSRWRNDVDGRDTRTECAGREDAVSWRASARA